MDREEIILRRLSGQHLLQPTDTQTVVKDLCGVQSQFLTHALHALSIRSSHVDTKNLVKGWSNRGTMHLFSADDLPLFLHQGRTHFLRPVDTLESDAYLSVSRKAYFAQVLRDAIAGGIDRREELKTVCADHGMSDTESNSIFDPWGGLIRALCESGQICHKVQEEKAYMLCPAFEPMEEYPARLELARRYFTHYGPATVKDAAYFFGTTQSRIKECLPDLNAEETLFGGKRYYHISTSPTEQMPDILFLAGFDQFLLGYDKKESLILSGDHLREIYNLAGIVRPAVLVDGQVTGWWNLKNHRLKITLFSPADQSLLADAAAKQWADLKHITFE